MKTKKTLKLRKETLATLSKESLAHVAGAGAGEAVQTLNLGCVSQRICPPTLPLCIPSIKAACV